MNELVLKLIYILILLVAIPICAFLPLAISNRISVATRDQFLSLGNALSGGIFLAGGFVHLLPEANEGFTEALPNFTAIPLAFVLCPLGFLFAFVIEKVIFLDPSKLHTHVYHHPHGHHHKKHARKDSDESGKADKQAAAESGLLSEENAPVAVNAVNTPEGESIIAHPASLDITHEKKNLIPDPNEREVNEFLPYLLAFILSVHSLVAGLAMGVQDNTEEVTAVFIAIISHKWAEAFALGSSVLKNTTELKQFLKIIGVYSLTTPAGILVGMLLESFLSGQAGKITTATCTALAAGTFLYVAVVDILIEEFAVARWKWLKLILCLLGMAFMTVLLLAFKSFDRD